MRNPLIRTIERAAVRQKSALWLVGGPVRDALLSQPCDDWDLVCRKARPIAREVAKALRAKFIVLDEQNRIYRVILPDSFRPVHTLDFAELHGRSIEEDLQRRDFTINAMAKLFPSGAVIDPFHGQRDLRTKTIRAVSEGAFPEDPLRLIRAFRFAAQFQFEIETKTLQWVKKHHHGLSKVAAERIREELMRLWKQPQGGRMLRLMDKTKVLSKIFPEIEACRRTAIRYYGAGGVLKHSFETVDNLEWIFRHIDRPLIQAYLQEKIGGYPRHAWLKWAAFLHDVGKPSTAKILKGRLRFFEHEHVGAGLTVRIAQRLRCSRQEVQLLGLWVRNHMRTGNLAAASRITGKALSRFFRDLGVEGVGMVLVSLADHYTYLSKSLWGKDRDPVEKMGYRLLASYYEEHSKILPKKLVDGHLIMRQLKLKPGPLIGRLLEDIQDAQAEGKVHTKEEAIAFAKRQLRTRK